MKTSFRFVFSFSLLVSSAFAGKSIATVTSAEPFALDGHSVNTPGVSSFPIVVGDTVATSRGPAVLRFTDGSAMKLGSNSSVRIAGVDTRPKVVLLAGALDYKLVPGSALSVTNLDNAEHAATTEGTPAPPAAPSPTAAPAADSSAFLHLHPGQIAKQSTPVAPTNNNAAVSATYTGEDTTTLGTWKGKYGSEGQLIASDMTNPPPYANVSIMGNATTPLPTDLNDPRALQSASGASARVVSTYANNFTIDLNLTDSNPHKISLYLADFDNQGRAETITIIDPATRTVLSTQNFAAFASGAYESWTIKGHVQIRVTSTSRASAIVNGIFFDAPGAAAAADNPPSGDSGASTAAPNANQGVFTNPKFLIPLAGAAAAGLAAALLTLPSVSRNQ